MNRALQKPGSVCRGLGLGVLPGEFYLSLLTGHLNLFPLCAHGSSDLVLLLGVKPSEAAWTLFMFMFISFCLFDILSILVAIV